MKNPHLILLTAVLLASATGCQNPTAVNAVWQMNREAKRTDNPYRYRVGADGSSVEKYRVVPPSAGPIPADLQPTAANAELQKDILAKIAHIQQGWGDSVGPLVLGVQSQGASDRVIRESWFVKRGDGAVRYEVTMSSSRQGGTDFSVTGPLD